MNIFKHLKTILIHKYWVFYLGRKFGIGWLTFWHDMSKFSPVEFFESVRYYNGTGSPIDACKKDKGYSLAWQHHKGHNPHHYEFWQDNFDKGTTQISMPDKYVKEMFCDFLAAAKTYNGDRFTFQSEYDWWMNKKSNPIAMHPNQIAVIDHMMDYIHHPMYANKDIPQVDKDGWEAMKIFFNYVLNKYNS